VGVRDSCPHHVQVVQAEFPGYVMPAYFAKNMLIPFRPKLVLVEHNVEYLRIADSAALNDRAQKYLRRIERMMIALCDTVVTVSGIDREKLISAGVQQKKITVIPLGVDIGSYHPFDGAQIRAHYRIPDSTFLLVYHGVLNYAPNYEAVSWLASEILPVLRASGNDVRLLLIGMNPPTAYMGDGIIVTGVVPDLPAHLAAADCAVVALKRGGGTRMKILEYFSSAISVVSTTKGAEGIDVTHDQEILLADSTQAIVETIFRLMDDHTLRRRIGEAGRRFSECHDWIEICRQYMKLYMQ
jgi:glycosyltransferase involved in cell wall biosynthesis